MDKRLIRQDSLLSQRNLNVGMLCILLCLGYSGAYAAESGSAANGQSSPATVAVEQKGSEFQESEAVVAEEEGEELSAAEYEYQVAARPDPFKPFIAPKTVNPNELVDENLELTGMQLFEPGQLNLVAVMDTPRGRLAMVEDVTKKGYKITQGQLIGRRGQVTEIRKDEVLVTETAYTRGGEEIKTVVSMKMKRDGDSK